MISSHFPALLVVAPLLAAPVCVLIHHPGATWAITAAVSWATFTIAGVLLTQVNDSGLIVYAMGSWAAPWGIEYRVDQANAFVLLIVSGASALATIFARKSVHREIAVDRISLFYTAWCLNLTGLLGIVITGDAFNLFVFLEIASLSSYALVSLGRDRRGLLAAFRYLIIGTIGATFILIGIGLLYMMTGSLNLYDISVRMGDIAHSRTVRSAFAFLALGIGIKMAMFPLHTWLPNAYSYAPSAVSVFLAATATKVAVYMALRFIFSVFGVEFSFGQMHIDKVLMPLALVGVAVASLVAIRQHNLKRMLAYSSIAQVGYMLLGLSFVSVTGLTGGIVHLFNHALMKATLFMALGCVAYRVGSVMLADLSGLGRRMPWTMAAFVVGGVSLIGVPGTVGFVTKWYLVLGAIEQGLIWVAFVIVVTSLMAAVYVWRVLEVAYFQEGPDAASTRGEAPLSMLLPMWVIVGANLFFGLHTELSAGAARRAAQALLGAG